MQAFLRFLATLVPLFEAGRAWLRRRRAGAARAERARNPVRLLCRRLGGRPDHPAAARTDEPASPNAGRD